MGADINLSQEVQSMPEYKQVYQQVVNTFTKMDAQILQLKQSIYKQQDQLNDLQQQKQDLTIQTEKNKQECQLRQSQIEQQKTVEKLIKQRQQTFQQEQMYYQLKYRQLKNQKPTVASTIQKPVYQIPTHTKDLNRLVLDKATEVQIAKFQNQIKKQNQMIQNLRDTYALQEEFYSKKCEEKIEQLNFEKLALAQENEDLMMKFYELQTVFNSSFEAKWDEVKDMFTD